ncbi:hypothetical protein CEXT_703161 [Caerostris extrusa]|uniref:Uncharacterized protein n=1 Tax=Caerostris extrusa TaxID=172846 RepID=A0AAV4X9X4_CAEEX|nr:hypothetical protein CEXT_703161 [Caerostris extrusa]
MKRGRQYRPMSDAKALPEETAANGKEMKYVTFPCDVSFYARKESTPRYFTKRKKERKKSCICIFRKLPPSRVVQTPKEHIDPKDMEDNFSFTY